MTEETSRQPCLCNTGDRLQLKRLLYRCPLSTLGTRLQCVCVCVCVCARVCALEYAYVCVCVALCVCVLSVALFFQLLLMSVARKLLATLHVFRFWSQPLPVWQPVATSGWICVLSTGHAQDGDRAFPAASRQSNPRLFLFPPSPWVLLLLAVGKCWGRLVSAV